MQAAQCIKNVSKEKKGIGKRSPWILRMDFSAEARRHKTSWQLVLACMQISRFRGVWDKENDIQANLLEIVQKEADL